MADLQFWEKKCFQIRFEWVQSGFLSERMGKVHVDGPKTEKVREPTVESLIQAV